MGSLRARRFVIAVVSTRASSATHSIDTELRRIQSNNGDIKMSNLTILSKEIRQFDGLFSLNDLHKASGSEEKHQPNQFTRRGQTKGLISEIEQSAKSLTALKIKIGGTAPGSYGCKEIVVAYASWISPKIHLAVIQAFLNDQPAAKAIHQDDPEKQALQEKLTVTTEELNCFKNKYIQSMEEMDQLKQEKLDTLENNLNNPRTNAPYSEEEIAVIVEGHTTGLSNLTIARQIIRSESGVRSFIINHPELF